MDLTPEALAESRRTLRALLTRRDFLSTASTIAVAIGGAGLAGCGGSDTNPVVPNPPPPPPPPGMPEGFQSAGGTISLPAGSALSPATLTVDVGTQAVAVSASGAFTVGLPTSGPSLALLVDAAGNGVLMSIFESGIAPTISARTSAVALIYYATGAYSLPASAMSQVLSLMKNDPAVNALENAIAQSVASDAHAIANNAAPIGPALSSALHTMIGTSVKRPTPRVTANATAPTLMLLTPSGEQNGVTVSQDPATTALLISNAKRRGCKVYVYEVTTLTGNVTTDVSPAVRVAGPIDLSSTENLGLFTALKDFATFFNGTSPWSPVNLPALPLTLTPATADRTTFHVIVLASSWKVLALDAQEPPFFRDPHYVNEVATFRADAQGLFYNTVFGDVFFPILCFFGGIGAITASRSVVAGIVSQAAAAKSATFTRILSQLEYGSLGQMRAGIQAVVNDAFASDLSTQFWKPEILKIVGQAESKALAAESQVLTQSRWLKGAKMFQGAVAPIFAAGLILDGIDFGAVLYDGYNSDIGSLWTALLIRQKLNLLPQDPRVAAGSRVNFTVSLPANVPTANIVYDWTQTSLFATLSAVGEANVGNSITTTKRAVDLVTTGSDANPVTVTVIGYDASKSPREEIGRAGTVVNFLLPAEILPTNVIMNQNQQQPFSVLVTGQLPNNISYKWTLGGTAGSIGSGAVVTTNVPQINFASGNVGGVGLLHVDVVDSAGVIWASADGAVDVVGPPAITFTLAGPWDPIAQPPNGTYSYPSAGDSRSPSPGGGGLDAIFFGYNLGKGTDQAVGVLLTILVPTGSVIRTGDTYTKVVGNTFLSQQFQLTLSNDQTDPDNIDARQRAPIGTGTFKFERVGTLLNGKTYGRFSFTIINAGGGTIVGSGSANW